MTIPSFKICRILVATIIVLSGCGILENHEWVRIPITRVEVASTIQRGDSAKVVFGFPTPCHNSLFLDIRVVQDTIHWELTAKREPGICSDEFVIDSFYTEIDPGRVGEFVIVYENYGDMESIPLTVVDP